MMTTMMTFSAWLFSREAQPSAGYFGFGIWDFGFKGACEASLVILKNQF
jgi:hypothetical protein